MIKRIIPVNFWSQRTVLEDYTLEERLFHVYLLTNQYTTQIGIYSLNQSYIRLETGLDKETVSRLLAHFEQELNLIRYHEETQEIAILHSLEFSIMRGGKPVLDLLRREIQNVRETTLILATYEAMCPFWRYSKRPFDQQIQTLFEEELASREVPGFEHDTLPDSSESKTKTKSNQNQIYNHKQTHTQNHNHKHKHNHIHNQDSCHDSSAQPKSNTLPTWQDALDPEETQLLSYYERTIGEISAMRFQTLQTYLTKMTVEVIHEAIIRSTKARHPYKYCLSILDNWVLKDIQHIGDLARLEESTNHTSPTSPVITPDWLLTQS